MSSNESLQADSCCMVDEKIMQSESYGCVCSRLHRQVLLLIFLGSRKCGTKTKGENLSVDTN